MIKGNKGEWAELYAFLKILSDGKLPSADESLSIERDRFFEFLKLYWDDSLNGPLVYKLGGDDITILSPNDEVKKSVPKSKVSSVLARVFLQILKGKGRSFGIPIAEGVMKELLRSTLKAPSSEKADIFANILDRNTGTAELSGFSVKSMLTNQATLLNASGQTLFRYELKGIDEKDLDEVSSINSKNSSSKYVDRALKIIQLGGSFHFDSMVSKQFEQTLRKIDTLLPEFVAEMLVGFYTKQGHKLSELVSYLSRSETILEKYDFELSEEDYEFKLKQLLSASALGMQPSKPWDGMMRANGGYLVVVQSGDVLCYHAFNRDIFLNYLFNNTRFESPASRDAPILELTMVDGRVYADLKLQIRFT